MSMATLAERRGIRTEIPLGEPELRAAVLEINKFIVDKHKLGDRIGQRVVAQPRTRYFFWDGTRGEDNATGTTSGTHLGSPYVLSTFHQNGDPEGERTFQVQFPGDFKSLGASVEGLDAARKIIAAESTQSDLSR